MKTLQRVSQRRRQMLMGMARESLLKGDFKKMLSSLGYDGSKRTLDPSTFRPPTDATQGFMQKWVQVALNVLLGTKMRIDGKLGPISRQAIKRFQRQEGITATGFVDDLTLQVLELRVGVRAPRHVQHEPLPFLMMLPKRSIWKPASTRKKRRKNGASVPDDTATDSRVAAAADEEVSIKRATPGVLQTEAMGAVAELAFDDDFVADAAAELGRKDNKKLRAEMNEWLRANDRDPENRPDWIQQVHDHARAHAERAASITRQHWWQQSVETK